MLKSTDIPKAWENFKQIEINGVKYVSIIRFKVMGKTYFGAVDKKGKIKIRFAPATLKNLTGCSAAKIKELTK